MHSRSQSRNNSPQQEASPVIVERLRIELLFLEDQFQEDPSPEVPMADNQTMAELLQAPTEGYEDAIVIPEITANNFELKHGLINLVQNKQFFKHDKEDPQAHICYFNKITSTMRVPNFFPPSKMTNLRNEITRFQQRFSELHQLDTFYNSLNVNDQDSLNSAAGGNFFDKMPRECLKIIKSRSKVRQSRAKAVVAKVSTSSSTSAISSEVSELKDMVRAFLLDKKNQSSAPSPTPARVKAVKPNCVTCGGSGTLPSNTITNPKKELKGITTRSGVTYQGPTIPTPSKVVKQGTEVTKDQVQTTSSKSTAPVQPLVVQPETHTPISKPVVAPVSALMPNLKSFIPYPSRRDNERHRDQANEQIEKLYEIFKNISFEISFTDALILLPKFASTLKALIRNKEKLIEMARTPMNEHCLAVILNKLPRKLRDPGKFLIPYEFPGMDECLALADLGASINLMPLFVWEALSLPELTLTCMTLKLEDRSVFKPIGIAKDVSFKVGTGRALIDVHKGELTLRIGNEAITYNLDQTMRYTANYNQITANKIDVIDMACEEYSQEVLSFFNVTASGNPTPHNDSIVSTTSPTLTPFGDSDFLLFEEADAFLASLNSEPLPPLPIHEQYLPSFKKELKVCEAKTIKSSVDEPPKVELKDLPPHLEYAFLEGDNKLPVIIAKELGDEEKSALIKILNPWVSPVHCVPKKGGFTVVKNEENELIPTRLVTGWRGTSSIVSSMVSPSIFKFTLTLMIRKRQRSPVLMARSPIDACLSVCAMHRERFKGEKSHFMVKEGIVLSHKISKNEIKVDKAKVDVIAKLPHPTTVKGAVLGKRHEKHFRPIHYASKTMTDAESNYTMTEKEMLAVVFGAPRAIISDRGTHFCNDQFAKAMLKYGVTHHLSTAYHPQTSGQVEVSNRCLKRILKKTIGENRASWSNKLDDALWSFRIAFKTPIGCTPYKLVYRKACHLPIELDHKAYWALKQANFNLVVAGDHRNVQLNELNKLHDHAYENSLIYKEKTKRIHDSKIKNRVFNVGDRVLLFKSRLKIFLGKLKTRWSGPFTIAKVFPYGTIELSQANGTNFKVNGHRIKHYFRGDVPQLDYPDCEVFRALSFSFTRASHPQLHFGNPVSKTYRLTFSFGIPNKWP
uniref:Reverse transcriptase domain-containing protein n=1 Tax=Tanacetum cinerariifolium TaxID=118510 RepID=A0A6L2JRF3_TANCI|nr:reverse transcriptase domain-containing protein [Tanacetum cinerariifolium]